MSNTTTDASAGATTDAIPVAGPRSAVGATRRTVLLGAAAAAGAGVLAACGSDSETDSETGAGSSGGSGSSSEPTTIVPASDVPVGGGVIAGGFVVTQPAEGEIKAFETTCPHQGCRVNVIEDGRILCPCHGSAFDVATGDVVVGPATSGLPEVEVTVTDGEVRTV